MKSRNALGVRSILVVASMGALPVLCSAQTIHLIALHNPPGCIARPRAMAGDGSRVFGDLCPNGWKWTVSGGFQALPEYGGTTPLSANFDGSVPVGYAGFPGFAGVQAAYWVDNFGAPLNPGIIPGYTYSFATDTSNNASVIVGYAQNEAGTNPPFVAVRWAAGGFTTLPAAPGTTTSSRATCISGDGQYIFGTSAIFPGIISVPTRWGPGNTVQALGNPPGEGFDAYPARASVDGSVAMGWGVQVHTWRWIDGLGYQGIASPAGTTARPSDMTGGGEAIVGSVYLNQDNSYAAFWTQSGQWMDLNSYLPTQGLNLNGWFLNTCFAVSDDGRTLAGTGFYNGQAAAWAITGIRSICGPRIVNQQTAVSKCSGQNAQVSVFAVPPSSPGAVSYQWHRRVETIVGFLDVPLNDGPTGVGSTISGVNFPSMFINNVRPQDAGQYWCAMTAGCATNPTFMTTLTVLPDISGNGGSIDTNDLTVLLGNFGQTVTPWTNGDLNGDGAVNTIDLTIFLGAFGTACP